MTASGVQTTNPWAAHRTRGEALRDRLGYAAEVLSLYLALVDAWTQAWQAAAQWSARRAIPPGGDELAAWAADRALPPVVAATARFGPRPLAAAVAELNASGDVEPLLLAWLSGGLRGPHGDASRAGQAGAQPDPVERYLARAVLRGPLAAVGAAAACAGDPSPRGGRTCPACGGEPQLSYRTAGDDPLVAGHRNLLCARCGGSWGYTGNACAGCGESAGARRTMFAERRDGPVVGRADPAAGEPLLPHLRIEACERCSRYLIDVDLGQDARAVPEVDELTALPLDLFATERGLTKVAPNLMGF